MYILCSIPMSFFRETSQIIHKGASLQLVDQACCQSHGQVRSSGCSRSSSL